jgi:hypothetical protein
MTGLIVTDTNFKRFAKNLKKLKPELSVVSAQEELAKIFGFKNLFNFKQSTSKKSFSISNENFKSLSCRLNVDLESSKVDDAFANIIGYKDHETFYLTSWVDDFIYGLKHSFPKETTVVDKCSFAVTTNGIIFNIQGKNKNKNYIYLYFSNSLEHSDKTDILNLERLTKIDDFDPCFKEELETHIKKIFNQEKGFTTKVTPFLRKKVFNDKNEIAKMIFLNRKNVIKVDEDYFETSYYVIPNSKLAGFQNKEEYSLVEEVKKSRYSYCYSTLDKAKDKLMSYSNINNAEMSEVCIVELREKLFSLQPVFTVLNYFLLSNGILVEKNISEEVLY